MKSHKKAVVKKAVKKPFIANDLIPASKLDLWIKSKFNVLFEGVHGIGKTAIILDAWKRAGLRYAYFSGATMDPFIDFVGVPITVHTKDGKQVIKLVRPQHLVDLDVQAIFVDEFNRTHKKVRNAVMELLQFKTINGKPLSSDLQMVWAAVNPEDDEATYDVDRLDPAQRDRFHVQYKIPYQCSLEFFVHKFGQKLGTTAVQFWNKLDKEVQKIVSPRRMEYALELFQAGGDLRDALPVQANPGKLMQLLKGEGYKDLEPLLQDDSKARDFFKDESNFANYHEEVMKKSQLRKLVDAFPAEKIASLFASNKWGQTLRTYMWRQIKQGGGHQFVPILEPIALAGPNGSLRYWAQSLLDGMKRYKGATPKAKVIKLPKGKTTVPILVRALHAVLNQAGIDYPTLSAALKREKHLGHNPSATMIKRRMLKNVKPWFEKRGFTVTELPNGWQLAK